MDDLEPDDDLFLEDADLAEDTEPQVWLVTVYPDPVEGQVRQTDVENALLVLPEVASVEMKRIS